MIQIITDSAADFEPRELKEPNVTSIPLVVRFGQEEYQENVDLDKDRFYELLGGAEEFPKTSQASPQVLMDLFESAHAQGDGAIYITLFSAISGTYQSALMTKELLGHDDCHVLDSRNATGGQRLIVQHAVKLRDEGKSPAEIIAGIEDIRERITLFACIDTLKYLYLGGRISQASYKIGNFANIKPIITVERDGHVGIPAKAMGMRKGMDYMDRRMEAITPDPDFPFYVMYTNNRDVARTLAEKLRAQGLELPEERIIQVGAAIGAHIGPEACGLVYVEKAD